MGLVCELLIIIAGAIFTASVCYGVYKWVS